MVRGLVVSATLLVGCAYQPGTFRYVNAPFAGARATVDCVDLAVSPRAQDDDGGGLIVHIDVGNRCDRPTVIDLSRLHVVGKLGDGREVGLVAFDPDAELTPLPLDARARGGESIAFRDPRGGDVVAACVDASSIVHAGPPRWLCADRPSDAQLDQGPAGDYVGHREQGTRFGQWALPLRVPGLFFEWGLEGRSVSMASGDVASRTDNPDGPGPATRVSAPAFTTSFRMGVGLAHHTYLGFEGEVGGVFGAAEHLTEPGLPTPGAATFGGGYLVTGVRGSLGRLGLATELAIGGRAVQGDTVTSAGVTQPGTSDAEAVVEARVRAELWISPWISTGATAGVNALDHGETMFGGFVSLHTRAFGGDHSR